MEHRYYGQTLIPSSHSTSDYSYLTIEQALADFSEVLTFLRRDPSLGYSEDNYLNNLNYPLSLRGARTFLFGGSYGGQLVAFHRLKYPHLSDGGIMSSAPVDFYYPESTPKAKN